MLPTIEEVIEREGTKENLTELAHLRRIERCMTWALTNCRIEHCNYSEERIRTLEGLEDAMRESEESQCPPKKN